jgi:hypothetical protein
VDLLNRFKAREYSYAVRPGGVFPNAGRGEKVSRVGGTNADNMLRLTASPRFAMRKARGATAGFAQNPKLDFALAVSKGSIHRFLKKEM